MSEQKQRGKRGGRGREDERVSLLLYRLHQWTDDWVEFLGEQRGTCSKEKLEL